MYKSFAIIGLGSLGGFVAREIANLEDTESMVLIDFDRVEEGNLRNSVYRKPHIGKLKVMASANLIKRDNRGVRLDLHSARYVEGETQLSQMDMIIDCRDVICNRGKNIDVRLYMSSRYLIIDCRKNVEYEQQTEGIYLTDLSKTEIKYAAACFSMLIRSGVVSKMIQTETVHKIYLDHLDRKTTTTLARVENKADLVRDSIPGEEKLIGLPENIFKILDMNKESNVEICVGDHNVPTSMTNIPKGYLRKPADVIQCLVSTIEQKTLPISFNYYIVSPTETGNKFYVELVPETGAA